MVRWSKIEDLQEVYGKPTHHHLTACKRDWAVFDPEAERRPELLRGFRFEF